MDEVSCEEHNQLLEIKNRHISKDENLLPVHFLPEGKQCYDWIEKDMKVNKENLEEISNSYAKNLQSPEHKQKTNSVNSVTYSSSHMEPSIGSSSGKDVLPKLLKCAEDGEISGMEEILNKCPTLINCTDGDGYTALHRASYSGEGDALIYLLKHGANVGAKTHDGWQPIHCATRWNNFEIVKMLLDHKADVNAATNGLQTPLHFAALSEDNVKILEMLLLNPAININVTNAAGDTPFDLAKRNGPQFKLFDLVDDGLKI